LTLRRYKMGGSINVFVRKSDRTLIKMTRWTNTIRYLTALIGHVDEDTHLASYMKEWLPMQEDWQENGPKGPFKHNMTPVYFPGPRQICKCGYGIVFADYVTKTVVGWQGYAELERIWSSSIQYDRHEDSGFWPTLVKLVENGQLRCNHMRNHNSKSSVLVKDLTVLEALSQAPDYYLIVDNSPWTFESYMEHEIPYKKIRARIKELMEK